MEAAPGANFRIYDSQQILRTEHRSLFFDKYNHALAALKHLLTTYGLTTGVQLQLRSTSNRVNSRGFREQWVTLADCQRYGLRIREDYVFGQLMPVANLVDEAMARKEKDTLKTANPKDWKTPDWAKKVQALHQKAEQMKPRKRKQPRVTYPGTSEKQDTTYVDKNGNRLFREEFVDDAPDGIPDGPYADGEIFEKTEYAEKSLWTSEPHRHKCLTGDMSHPTVRGRQPYFGKDAEKVKEDVIKHNVAILQTRYPDGNELHLAYMQMLRDMEDTKELPFIPEQWLLV